MRAIFFVTVKSSDAARTTSWRTTVGRTTVGRTLAAAANYSSKQTIVKINILNLSMESLFGTGSLHIPLCDICGMCDVVATVCCAFTAEPLRVTGSTFFTTRSLNQPARKTQMSRIKVILLISFFVFCSPSYFGCKPAKVHVKSCKSAEHSIVYFHRAIPAKQPRDPRVFVLLS